MHLIIWKVIVRERILFLALGSNLESFLAVKDIAALRMDCRC